MGRTVLILAMCAALLAAACSTTPAPPAATPTSQPLPGDPAAPAGKVSFTLFGDPAEKAAYEQVVAAFKEQYPQVDVRMMYVPDEGEYLKRLAADFAAGAPPDVMLLDYRQYAAFAARGVLAPIAPYLTASYKLRVTEFYTQSLVPFYWHGVLTCVPQSASPTVVYYNKALFDQAGVAYPQAGWTWDDLLSAARATTRADQGQYGLSLAPSLASAAPFVWQNGAELVFNTDAPTRLSLDKPEALEALQWFVDLQLKEHVVPDAVEAQAEDAASRFQNGRAAMYIDGRRAVPRFRNIQQFDWDVAPLPQGKQAATLLESDGYCLSALTANKHAGWAFIEFAASVPGQTILAETGRSVPSLASVASSPAFLVPGSKPQNSQVFLESIGELRSMPVVGTWIDVEMVVDSELERAFYGLAPVAEAIDSANFRVIEFLKLAIELRPTPVPGAPGAMPTPLGGVKMPECASHVATVALVDDFPEFPFPPGTVFLQSYSFPESGGFYTLGVTPMVMPDAVKYYQDALTGTGYSLSPGDAEPGEIDLVISGNGRTGNLRAGVPLGCETVTIVEVTWNATQ